VLIISRFLHIQELPIQNLLSSYIYWLANMLVSIKTDFWCLNSLFGEYRKSNRGRSEPYMVVSTDVLLNFWMRKLLNLWGIVHPKYKFCHHLLTLMLFQTCMTYFLYWNKDDIFNNVLFLLTSIVWEKKSMEVAHAIEVGCPYHQCWVSYSKKSNSLLATDYIFSSVIRLLL